MSLSEDSKPTCKDESSCHCCEGREWVVSAFVWVGVDVQCGSHMYVYATRTAHPLHRLRSGENALCSKTHNRSLKAEAVGTVRVCLLFALLCIIIAMCSLQCRTFVCVCVCVRETRKHPKLLERSWEIDSWCRREEKKRGDARLMLWQVERSVSCLYSALVVVRRARRARRARRRKGAGSEHEGRKKEGKGRRSGKGGKEALFISFLEGAKAKRGFNYAF